VVDYQDWRMTLRLLSPLGMPMQSDTLFGHLCWQVAFADGDEGVKAFLEPFLEGQPPFVLSDAFPAGLLPRPFLPRAFARASSPQEYADRNRWEKAAFLSVDDFLRLARGEQTPVRPVEDPWKTVETPHAAINRLIDTTGSREDPAGQFYHTEALALAGDGWVQVYVRARPSWNERVLDLFQRLSLGGFGRDKSVGYGQFSVESFQPWEGFHGFEGADAFVSLSTLMPAAGDPVDGRWRLRVKRGYLGEHGGQGNPFKRPLLQLVPGAVFRVADDPPRPFYGRMVPEIAPGMAEAVQCGYALSVPCRWREA